MKKLLSVFLAAFIILCGCTAKQTAVKEQIESQPAVETVISSQPQAAESASADETTAPGAIINPSTPDLPVELSDEEARQELYLSTAPAKQSWRKAYESFYSAIVKLEQADVDKVYDDYINHDSYNGAVKARGIKLRSDSGIDFIYPQFSYGYLALKKMADEDPSAKISQKLASLDSMYGDQYGFLASYQVDGSFAGEGSVGIYDNKVQFTSFKPFSQGEYENRTSLTITEGMEAQLLDLGFTPDATGAFSLSISDFYGTDTYGICFYDAKKAIFYQNAPLKDNFVEILPSQRFYTFEQLGKGICSKYGVCSLDEIKQDFSNPVTAKPVIYLYPEQPTEISVKLGYPEEYITYTYPAYNGGWRVLAQPDGTLTNLSDNSEHCYLFWEGDKKIDWDMSKGFVVKGGEVEAFLREKLAFMGLTPREYNDFITYWAPEMSKNEYNLISFSAAQYEALAPLFVTPAPDGVLRVHMVYKPIPEPVAIEPQQLESFSRSGFTVVEWGGSRAW